VPDQLGKAERLANAGLAHGERAAIQPVKSAIGKDHVELGPLPMQPGGEFIAAAPTSSQRNRKCDLRGITKPRAPIIFPHPSNRSEGNHTSAKLGFTSEAAVTTTGMSRL